MAYLGFLFEEDRVHSASLDHYLSAIRTRHAREDQPDPCTGPHQRDLIRAFRREDDARGALQDVRAAVPASVVWLIRDYGLRQHSESIEERDAALIEFQYLLSWRESSGRTVQVQDVFLNPVGISTGEPYLELIARPRTLKGRAVRGQPSSRLLCRGAPAANPLALQARYYRHRHTAHASDLYWSHDGDSPDAQHVTRSLQRILGILQVVPPPFCYYASHSLRSGSVTALILLGVPLPVVVLRGPWTTERMVINVYFDGRIQVSPEMSLYFWSLLPSAQLPPPQ